MSLPDRPLVLLVTSDETAGAALARDLEQRFGVISVPSFEAAFDVVQSVRLDAVFTGPSGLDVLRLAERAQPNALRVLVAAQAPQGALDPAHVVIGTPCTSGELTLLNVILHDPVERALARARTRWSS